MKQNKPVIETKLFSRILLSAAVILGAAAHFSNLSGVIYLSEDEARCFTLMGSGPLMFVLASPVYQIFREQWAVFGVAGLYGFASVLICFLIMRMHLSRNAAALAAVFYAIWPLRITYARTLFPSVFVEFFFLLSLYFTLSALKSGRHKLLSVSGLFASMTFFCHTFSYALIAGVLSVIIVWSFINNFRSGSPGLAKQVAEFFRPLIIWSAGFFAGFILIQGYFYFFHNGYDYIAQTIAFGKYTSGWSKSEYRTFVTLFEMMISSPTSLLLTATVTVSALVILIQAIRARVTIHFLLFVTAFLSGGLIFILMSVLKVHTIYERHFVWLTPLYASLIAGSLRCIWRSGLRPVRAVLTLFTAILILLAGRDTAAIIKETPDINLIRGWISANNIPRHLIMTSWWQINRPDGKMPTQFIPGKLIKYKADYSDPTSLYFGEGEMSIRFSVDWESVFKLYQAGRARYILTSGIDLRASLGEKELLLQNVSPLVRWDHPYKLNSRRPYLKAEKTIALYDLKDVFTRSNIDFVKQEKIRSEK